MSGYINIISRQNDITKKGINSKGKQFTKTNTKIVHGLSTQGKIYQHLILPN